MLGNIIKITPSSKVVGDMAQFMVQSNLTEADVINKADTISVPSSVIEYFQGYLGISPFGFPEPLRSKVLAGKKLPNGKQTFEGRPGAEMPPMDFDAIKVTLHESETDVVSYSQYPKVFEEYMAHKIAFGDVAILDTRTFRGYESRR